MPPARSVLRKISGKLLSGPQRKTIICRPFKSRHRRLHPRSAFNIRIEMNSTPGTDRGAETIAAVATPPGRGGIGILRLSGPTPSPSPPASSASAARSKPTAPLSPRSPMLPPLTPSPSTKPSSSPSPTPTPCERQRFQGRIPTDAPAHSEVESERATADRVGLFPVLARIHGGCRGYG